MGRLVSIPTFVLVVGFLIHDVKVKVVKGKDLSSSENQNYTLVILEEGSGLSQVQETGPIPPKNENLELSNGTRSLRTCSCGKRNTNGRIVGGVEARRNEFPWRCYLRVGRNGHCSCTIISNRWIMTAAHCTGSSSITVVVGDHDRASRVSGRQEIVVDRIVNHPQYNTRTLNNDISLLRLRSEIRFNENVSPVCLPFRYERDDFSGTTVTASGWGLTAEGGRTSNILRKVDIPVLTTQQCRRYWTGGVITDNMICTYQQGRDTCQGDSGGSIDLQRGGHDYAIGVVSFGSGCARRNSPGVYCLTTKYLGWIRSTTGDTFCQP